jgi:transaldolase
MDAFADPGEVRGDTVRGTGQAAQELFDALAEAGIDIDDVYQVLEDEGVDKFDKSWAELLASVQDQLAKAKG